MANLPNIPIDESQDIYADIDNPYFPAGKTPKYIYVSFSGIQPGSVWYMLPGAPPPPNGTWRLTQHSVDEWVLQTDKIEIAYALTNGFWRIFCWLIFDEGYMPAFFNLGEDWEYHSDDNYYQLYESTCFYGGHFEAAWFPDSGPCSIANIANLIGFERSNKAFYQGLGQTSTQGTYRLACRKNKSCIRILIDKSV